MREHVMGVRHEKKTGSSHFAVMRNIASLQNIAENFFIVILVFYPLRHVQWGLDLMDTGYNYANYAYMGTEHMDPMWLFSTWLSNAVGHLFTTLPGGGNLVGMNIYTGLFVSMLALAGYLFCTKELEIRPWVAFLGEMAAISLCWCPTALLYNYMTYALFLVCFILLYYGLINDEKRCLIGAGVCLGANVLVRFSNLPEAAMILAVWLYDFECAAEERRIGIGPQEGFCRKMLRHTGWCLSGYLAALAILFGYIHIRYGIGEYAAGISRLFAMTDTATDYRPVDMVINMLRDYIEIFYWIARMGVFLAAGILLSVLAGLMKLRGRAASVLKWSTRLTCVAIGAVMTGWLYYRDAEGLRTAFCSLDFCDYGSIGRPGILFLTLALFTAAIRVLHPKSGKEERLVGSMVIMVILLTSIGSNNRTYSSMNNLFIAAPYTLWACWKFITECGDKKISRATIPMFPIKCILSFLLLLCLFQFGGFGVRFAFAEASGIRDISAKVENNEILKNVGMSEEKARWMSSISAYVNENGLRGQEVILYGSPSPIPSLSYYLQMPAAFNPWINLRSYSCEAMEEDMRELREKTPVVILENVAALYEEGGESALVEAKIGNQTIDNLASDIKLQMILKFMREKGYEQTFRNEKFAIYQCALE